MPRKSKESPNVCQYFTWGLFCRDGVWYADGRGGKYDLGKHSLGTRDYDEALDRLKILDRQKALELGLAEASEHEPIATITIAEGWKLFLESSERASILGGVAPKTAQRYKAVRDKHVKFCSRHGITTWDEFGKFELEKYGNQSSRKYAYRTTYFELTLLKSVNNWLINNQRLPAEAKLRYALRKPQGTDTYCYRPAEVAAMFKHCMAIKALVWLGYVIFALAHTGLRISELAGLRWSDVDLKANTIRVMDERSSHRKQQVGSPRTTKGRRTRTIPIHPQLRALLLQMEHKSDGYVFHAQLGGRLRSNNTLHQFIEEVIEPLKAKFSTPTGDIGFEHGRLHSFRHYFCSQAFLGGASEGEIKEWLGHADSKMVEHYRHLHSEDAQRKMKQIDFIGPMEMKIVAADKL